ncbi:MAG: hypothetical protein CL783_05235 [Chloroflexi bacterium]|nr:hypothetical protein [Chloroflexota bacterium]
MKLEGKHALLQMFVAEGVNYVFGNPGTSETPMMTILPEYKDLDYILVLQEGVAVGMAEGYGEKYRNCATGVFAHRQRNGQRPVADD